MAHLTDRTGLDDEPLRILKEMGELGVVDVVLLTHDGRELRQRCVTEPSAHQEILLKRPGWDLPSFLRTALLSWKFALSGAVVTRLALTVGEAKPCFSSRCEVTLITNQAAQRGG
jgi:hypothetical protein